MTEISQPWDGTSVGDASRAKYDAEEWAEMHRDMFGSIENKGPLREGSGDGLSATSPSANVVRLATGAALVWGWWYKNTAAVDLAVGSASAGSWREDCLVLRVTIADQEVRARIHENEIGENVVWDNSMLTQTADSIWEIPLYTVRVDDAGSITLTDIREWIDLSTADVTPSDISAFSYLDYITLITVDRDGISRGADSYERQGPYVYIDPDGYEGTVTWTFYANFQVDTGDGNTADVRLTYPGGTLTLSTTSHDEDHVQSNTFTPSGSGTCVVDIRNASVGDAIRFYGAWIIVEIA